MTTKKTKTEEEYLAWFAALDIRVEDTVTIAKFQTKIDHFLNAKTTEGKERQRQVLGDLMQFRYEDILPADVTPRVIDFKKRGKQLRFAIKKFRGWFGIEGVKRVTGIDLRSLWQKW